VGVGTPERERGGGGWAEDDFREREGDVFLREERWSYGIYRERKDYA
jgi:hypothetical protein